MAKTKSNHLILVLTTGIVIRLIILFISSWHPDLNNHLDWGIRFLKLGTKNFYENIFWGVSWPNQPFGSMLLFAAIAFIKNIIFNFLLYLNNTFTFFPSFIIPFLESHLHIWLVKLPFIISDLGISFLIYQIVSSFQPKKALLATSLFLFNPVIIYNSTVWGQTDSFINILALLGLYLLFKKNYFSGITLFLLSFVFKLSLIIYLPIFGLLLLKNISDYKKFFLPIVTFLLFLYLLAIPFTFGNKTPFQWLWYMYTNRVLFRQGSMLNGNAFNLWFLLFGIDYSKSEFLKYGPFTYQTWGRLLYFLFILPVYFKFFRSRNNLQGFLTALMLSAFGAFIFFTNMHERYLYPIFPIVTILIFFQNSKYHLKSIIVLSLLHFLNLYNLWFYPLFTPLKELLVLSDFSICRIFSFILILIYLIYSINYLKSEA